MATGCYPAVELSYPSSVQPANSGFISTTEAHIIRSDILQIRREITDIRTELAGLWEQARSAQGGARQSSKPPISSLSPSGISGRGPVPGRPGAIDLSRPPPGCPIPRGQQAPVRPTFRDNTGAIPKPTNRLPLRRPNPRPSGLTALARVASHELQQLNEPRGLPRIRGPGSPGGSGNPRISGPAGGLLGDFPRPRAPPPAAKKSP